MSGKGVRRKKGERGAAAVEFAIVLIPLMLLLLGAVEFGLILFNQQVLTNATREGARAGIVQAPRADEATIRGIVKNYCADYLVTFAAPSDPDVTITAKDHTTGGAIALQDATFSDDLTVQATYSYTFLALPNFVKDLSQDGTLPLSAVTVMKYE